MPHVIERTIFKFDELSPEAKTKALDDNRDWNTGHDWWDDVYEDAVTCAECLGITIDREQVKTKSGSYMRTDIYFRGFWSQGDGACFKGSYQHDPESRTKIAEHAPQDEALKAIAEELAVLQTTMKLTCNETVYAKITADGNYCHSGMMSINAECDDPDVDLQDAEDTLTDLMRRFADWIYRQLKAEHEHLTSDEAIKEALQDQEFEEDGSLI